MQFNIPGPGDCNCLCPSPSPSPSPVSPSPSGVDSDCDECSGTNPPRCWELVVGGVTDNDCDQCNEDINGTFILKNDGIFNNCNTFGGNCAWCTDEKENCGEGTADRFNLTFGGGTTTLVIFARTNTIDPASATYRQDPLPFNCNQSITLELISSTSDCSNFPSQLTIEPINCPPS